MAARPEIDRADCTLCESCVEICPEVFVLNQTGGYVEVAELGEYPRERVQEAMALCPADCIAWVEGD